MTTCSGYISTALGCPDEFEQQIVIVLLDKLVLALVILAAAAIGKLYFDRYQKRQEYNKARALKRLDCLADLYRALMAWHTEYETWFQEYGRISLLLEQSSYAASEEERNRQRDEARSQFEGSLIPRDKVIHDMRATLLSKLDDYDFWLEDELLERFTNVLEHWADLGKKLQSEHWPSTQRFRPEAMQEVAAIQGRIASCFAELKAEAKSYL